MTLSSLLLYIVFGSRSELVTSGGLGSAKIKIEAGLSSAKIKIEADGMMSDRVVLPGTSCRVYIQARSQHATDTSLIAILVLTSH